MTIEEMRPALGVETQAGFAALTWLEQGKPEDVDDSE